MEPLLPLVVSVLPRGWVGRQQAHLSSGPLGFAEGSSTASLFLWSAPRNVLQHNSLTKSSTQSCQCFLNHKVEIFLS